MTPLALFLLSHGARTIPSSRLTKELIHLGYRPVCLLLGITSIRGRLPQSVKPAENSRLFNIFNVSS